MDILYFSPVPFEPVLHGNISTINKYIKRLKDLGHKVHFVYYNEGNIDLYNQCKMFSLVDTFDIIPFVKKKIKRDKRGYFEFDTKYPEGLGEYIVQICEKYNIQAIICTYIFYSKILEFVPSNIIKIIDTHDKMTDRHLSLEKNHIIDEMFSCTQEDEAKYLNRADIIWARRDEETEFFNKITNSNKAITVTHFEPEKFITREYHKLNKIGILASNNQVNYKMICDFVQKFNEKMEKFSIDVELIITGQIKTMIFPPYKPFRTFSNLLYTFLNRKDKIKGEFSHCFKKNYINVTGAIDDIGDFYKKVDLVIVPITFGTGINVKMVEAMAYGVPLISTECGIKGMNSDSEFHHCKDLNQVIYKIYEIYQNPNDLIKLSLKSRCCYSEFLNNAMLNFDNTFKNSSRS